METIFAQFIKLFVVIKLFKLYWIKKKLVELV